MVESRRQTESDEFRGARLRIYGTNQDNPDEERVFVWTKTGWFERIEGSQGNVAFTPVAESEAEMRELIARDNPAADLFELGGDFRKTVAEEFLEQSITAQDYPEATQGESEDEDENQQYHQHN
jgi:hypothetical protein